MGYLGVKTLVAHIKGETVERRIDTGVRVVTRENMDTPEMKELLQPDLVAMAEDRSDACGSAALRDARHPQGLRRDGRARRRRPRRSRRAKCARSSARTAPARAR